MRLEVNKGNSPILPSRLTPYNNDLVGLDTALRFFHPNKTTALKGWLSIGLIRI
jgi:hypothetical protein